MHHAVRMHHECYLIHYYCSVCLMRWVFGFRPRNGTSKPVPVRRGQMRAPGARLRPVPLPARESPNPNAASAHTQRKIISGACSPLSRTLVLAPRSPWTDMDASSPCVQQEIIDFHRGGTGRARTGHRQAGASLSRDFWPGCAALGPVLGCPHHSCPGKGSNPAATCHGS